MSIKSGFGSLTDVLISTVVAGTPVASNRHLIIQLPSKNEKDIYSISASYINEQSNTTFVNMVGGRLLVVGSKYSDDSTTIFPRSRELPTGLSAIAVFFDMPVANKNPQQGSTGSRCLSETFTFDQPLRIPNGLDASIILCYPETDNVPATTFPDGGRVLAFLNVNGEVGGRNKIFKNI